MMPLPQRLADGRPYVGTLVTVASPEVAESLAIAGLDWLFVDMEHAPAIDPAAVLHIVQAVRGRLDVLVRVPANDEVWIKKVLDAGADGVIVPHVTSGADARRAVRSAKYPPLGGRSVGITPAHAYGADFTGYMERANGTTSLVVQIEDAAAVDNIDEILAVPGVDGAFIGPYDLSGSFGKLGQLTDPVVADAINKVIAKCRAAAMPLGIYAATAAAAGTGLDRGLAFVAVGTDLGLLMTAAKDVLAHVAGR